MAHVFGDAAAGARPIPARDGGDREALPRLAGLGRLTGAVLSGLGILGLGSGGLVLLAEASGLATGGLLNATPLLASGFVCAALAAVAGGLARAATRASAAPPSDMLLVTCHGPRGEVVRVERQGGPFTATAAAALEGMALFEWPTVPRSSPPSKPPRAGGRRRWSCACAATRPATARPPSSPPRRAAAPCGAVLCASPGGRPGSRPRPSR